MEGQDCLPVICIVGTAGAGKTRIAARLCQSGNSEEQDIWQVDTRYYTADVRLVCLDTGSATTEHDPEAVVLVCSADSRDSFLACTAWQEAGGISSEIQLCIINKRDLVSADSSPDYLPDCQQWCQQQGFEVVEVRPAWQLALCCPSGEQKGPLHRVYRLPRNKAITIRTMLGHVLQVSATDLTVDARLGQREEGQGMRRVISALQAHMWPGMQLKVRGPAEPGMVPELSVTHLATGR